MEQVSEINDVIETILALSIETNANEIHAGFKTLRNLGARGSHFQETIAKHQTLNNLLQQILFEPVIKQTQNALHLMALQLLANSIVGNSTTQHLIWTRYGTQIAKHVTIPPLDKTHDILLMIMYNIHQGDTHIINDQIALQTCIAVWQTVLTDQCTHELEYLHFFFEQFLVHNARATLLCYSKLNVEERIALLEYIANYLRCDSPNGEINSIILQQFSKEFKMKSDCVLRQMSQLSNQVHPREVHTLLRIIALASGSENYAHVFSKDYALFLNVSSLLRCLVEAAKKPDGSGLPQPMTKLEQVALTSNISADYEKDVSFELKTLLVRCTANLLYKNPTNKQYSLDTQLIPTLLECTTMDARNPLMKEWSILAIRNACIDCPEVQQVIANLTMQGTAKNDILSELNLEMGALRIAPKKEAQ